LDNTISPEYGYSHSSIISLCKPNMSNFDTIMAEVTILGHTCRLYIDVQATASKHWIP